MAQLNDYKALKTFSANLSIKKDEVRKLTDDEARRFGHLVEPVNSQDGRKNKKYKKGINKGE